MRGHNTCRYYPCLCTSGLGTCHTLHKKPCRIGPGLCRVMTDLVVSYGDVSGRVKLRLAGV